jgi:hypothetical protein
VKKGRHRRFEEARALKRNTDVGDLDGVLLDEDPFKRTDPCDECGAVPSAPHASWCLADEDDPYSEYDERTDD